MSKSNLHSPALASDKLRFIFDNACDPNIKSRRFRSSKMFAPSFILPAMVVTTAGWETSSLPPNGHEPVACSGQTGLLPSLRAGALAA